MTDIHGIAPIELDNILINGEQQPTQAQVRPDLNMSLYDITLGEVLWPHEKRQIHCLLTGKPWGLVTEAYVKETIAAFDGRATELQTIIDQITLFTGPSPLWQSRVPGKIARNKAIDPTGFLIYMLNRTLRATFEAGASGNLDFEINWRKDMAASYKLIARSIEPKMLDDMNNLLVMLDGEGLLPPAHLLAGKTIGYYASKPKLEELAKVCRQRYKARNQRNVVTYANQVASSISRRVSDKTLNIEGLSDGIKSRVYDLMVVDLLSILDTSSTPAEKARAKSITGVASPFKFSIDKFAAIQEAEARATGIKVGVVPTVRVVPGGPFPFNFGGKKKESGE